MKWIVNILTCVILSSFWGVAEINSEEKLPDEFYKNDEYLGWSPYNQSDKKQNKTSTNLNKIISRDSDFQEDFKKADDALNIRDCKKALSGFKKLGEKDVPHAQFKLGYMYATGTCAIQDLARGYMWFALSSSNGLDFAQHNLSITRQLMSKEELAKAKELTKTCTRKYFKKC